MTNFIDHADTRPPSDGARPIIATLFWAVAALTSFIIAVIWAYDLGMRDPAKVPAIGYDQAEYREVPQEPGGRTIPDQDRRAYDALSQGDIAAAEAAFPAAAAERPTEGDREVAKRQYETGDLVAVIIGSNRETTPETALGVETFGIRPSGSDGLAAAPPATPHMTGVGPAQDGPEQTGAAAAPAADEAQEPSVAAIGPTEEPQSAQPQEQRRKDKIIDQAVAEEIAARVAEEVGGGAAQRQAAAEAQQQRATREQPRAKPQAAQSAEQTKPAPAQEKVASAAAAPKAPELQVQPQAAPKPKAGGYVVQLGALESEQAVRDTWANLRKLHGDLLNEHQLIIQPVQVGDTKLYRLRAGSMAARSEAQALCDALKIRGPECYVARR